jgi:hypothetical protein
VRENFRIASGRERAADPHIRNRDSQIRFCMTVRENGTPAGRSSIDPDKRPETGRKPARAADRTITAEKRNGPCDCGLAIEDRGFPPIANRQSAVRSPQSAMKEWAMRRIYGDVLASLAALAVVAAALVAVDDRVRDQFTLWFTGPPSKAELVNAGARVRDVTMVVFDAARDQSLEHAPLMIFVLAASVLLLFMLRTT